LKLSDDEIDVRLKPFLPIVELYFMRSAVLWAFCRTNHRFEFQKRNQLFIHTHNETLVDLWEISPIRLEDNESHTEEIYAVTGNAITSACFVDAGANVTRCACAMLCSRRRCP
jgi:hypothetical protein